MQLLPNPFGQVFQNLLRNFVRRWSTKPPATKRCTNMRANKVLRDKVAIVTGGACGLGYEFVKECLKRGASGVTIADIRHCDGERAAKQLCKEFGQGRCMFIKCDVTKSELFDWVFKQTLRCYGHIDLLINNAGILNDKKWEQAIATNMGGCIIGSLLAIQYMTKACVGKGGMVINISSVYGIIPLCGLPIYSMTNSGIMSFSRSLGRSSQYDRTGVKVVSLCVGPMCGPMLDKAADCTMNDKFKVELLEELEDVERQLPEKVAKGLSKILKKGRSGSTWLACNGYQPFEISLPEDLDAMRVHE
ncbi:hypothetical protein Trydic_g3550 [Trypoxylus dichotomus]